LARSFAGPEPARIRDGDANFYYLLDDHRREVEELLAIMHAKRLQEYEIVARRTPAEVVVAMRTPARR